LTLRLGRQELYYGSGRLVDARFGLNTRISFDGAKVIAQAGNTHIEAFVTRPTLQKPGIFDDVPDSKKAFWGIYSATATRLDRSVEFYYFGAQQTFSVGTAYFQSHTVGGRWADKKDGFDFDEEANVQLGKFGKGDIRAWSAAFNNGYSLETTKGRPRISLRSDVTSGDNDLDDRHLGTFYPLYARGKYFGEADLNGPVNTIDLIPQLDIHLSRRLTTDLRSGHSGERAFKMVCTASPATY
jgi:Alginate export